VLIWYISGKLPWPERRPQRFVLAHLAMGFAFAGMAAVWFTMPLLHGIRGLTVDIVLRGILPWQLASNLFLYGLVAGGSYAVRGSWGTREGRLAAERAERLRAQAELAALRAHINPHFLFNTLHSVTQLLRAEPARAEEALERLSELFRYALRLDRDRVEVVSLDDEWRFTSSYLWLEQMRMGDRLTVAATLSDDALLCAVPPFTLQPLVENAVRHGLSSKRGPGTIHVCAQEIGGVLQVNVADDGVGADPAMVVHGGGIGVRAVRQRLEARHGAHASMNITGAPGAGLTVAIAIPAEPAP
jgi:LytS/YehU family sensor histidine kinase